MVLPDYANTHTIVSWSGRQSTFFRHEAKDIIRRILNASENDAVIFYGKGKIMPMHKLLNILKVSNWGKI